ncbi:hypothetical protein D1872_285720 [compost metagenome]
MNSHFQSSEVTWMTTGFSVEASGLEGSNAYVYLAVMMEMIRMITIGIPHHTVSSLKLSSQCGLYLALLSGLSR